MSSPGLSPTALVVGRGPASAQTALELAQAGVGVTLLTAEDWLTPGANGPVDVPLLLEATRHPQINLTTGATVSAVQNDGRGLRLTIHQKPLYVDPRRCTACGACAEVCPELLNGANASATVAEVANGVADASPKAIHRGAVPSTYAIDKAGSAPCRHACPIDQRAQAYIALIRAGDFQAAYDCIKRDNPFPAICGRVCNQRCEDACSRGKADAPVNIMGLKRFVTDWVLERGKRGTVRQLDKPEPTGKKVAVVGAGPAGLTCALDLVRRGHSVTVYEALPVAGGMMRVGVPEYRLPHHLVRNEIDDILNEGVELVLNHRVENAPGLLKDGFDAVFLAVGAHGGVRLPIPGSDLPEVLLAADFLRAVSLRDGNLSESLAGKRVLVLGGGNVAVDTAMTVARLRAAWTGMACLESRENMPAHEWEVRDAEEEGIALFPSRAFKEVTSEAGHVTGARCAQIDFRGFKDGRPDFDELPGAEQVIAADVVIFAIGQRPQVDCLQDQVETIGGCFPAVDPETLATSIPGIFAGGDVVTGTAFIVDAIAAGRRAARAIDCYLRGLELAVGTDDARLPAVELDEAEVQRRLATGQAASTARAEAEKRAPSVRQKDFREVYSGLTEANSRAEAERCLSCGVCSECLQCEEACAANAISHERQPQTWESTVGAVIWPDATYQSSTLSSLSLASVPGVFVAEDHLSLAGAVGRALEHLDVSRPRLTVGFAAPSQWEFVPRSTALLGLENSTRHASQSAAPWGLNRLGEKWQAGNRNAELGVFLCGCGGEIERTLDLSAVTARVEALPDVTMVRHIDFACHAKGSELIRSTWNDLNLDGAVLAACSCCALDQICYSCTTQRIRCKERLGIWDGLRGLPIRFVNVREQCAFVHRDRPDAATIKAGDLIAASVAALSASRSESRVLLRYAGGISAATYEAGFPVTASIDLMRCRGCEDCEIICGLHAIKVVGTDGVRVAQVDPSLCLGCGVCTAVCSSAAIFAGDISDAQVEAQLSAMGDLGDKTVAFSCNWGAYSAIEAAGVEGLIYDPSVRLLRMMCAGRVHTGLILQAFVQGAARALVLTCGHEDEGSLRQSDTSQCRYRTGNDQAKRSVEQAQRLLGLLGIDPERLAMVELQPGDAAQFVAAVEEFVGAKRMLTPAGQG